MDVGDDDQEEGQASPLIHRVHSGDTNQDEPATSGEVQQ